MEILTLTLLLFAVLVIWTPYHLTRGRKHHKGAEESFFAFAGGLYVTIICICVPIVWPFLILSLLNKPKRPRNPVPAVLHADGKNWL